MKIYQLKAELLTVKTIQRILNTVYSIEKAELIEKAIYSLPEKYKRVMIMRELMNKPYLEIAELCSKEINFNMRNQRHDLKSIAEYSKIVVKNTGKDILKIKLSDYSSNVIEYKIKPEVK